MVEQTWCKRLMIDVHAEISLPVSSYFRHSPELYAEKLEYEARDLENFLRDHRSRDAYGISIIREYGYKCVYCGYVYQEAELTGEPICCKEAALAYLAEQNNPKVKA